MQSQGTLVQPDGSPITNPLGADLSIPVDNRLAIIWRGFEFTSRGRPTTDHWMWRNEELCSTLTRYDNGVWICRGIAGGPSDSGDSAALAIERAVDGLVKQQELARKTLAKIALRDDD